MQENYFQNCITRYRRNWDLISEKSTQIRFPEVHTVPPIEIIQISSN